MKNLITSMVTTPKMQVQKSAFKQVKTMRKQSLT